MFPQFHNPGGRPISDLEALPGDRPTTARQASRDTMTEFQAWCERYRPMERFWAVTGRTLLAAIFLLSAFNKIMDWSGTEAHMLERRMVFIPFFLAAAIVFEIAGGLS